MNNQYLYRVTILFDDESPLEAEKSFTATSEEEAESLCYADVKQVLAEVEKRQRRRGQEVKLPQFNIALVSTTTSKQIYH